MSSFSKMKKLYENSPTIGQQLKEDSDMIMQLTFDNDVNTRQCYIYDCFHDDNSDQCYGYNPSLDLNKTPVKLKFIITNYKTLGKDDPEAHIMFEPDTWNSQSCVPDYFKEKYSKYGIEFPIGLFVDIPDDRGVYHKWLITYLESANQNVKLGVVRCNYQFMWIEDDGFNRYVRKLWGFERAKGNYNAKSRRGDKVLEMDDQEKFIIPWNKYSMKIKHDDRFIISMLQPHPFAYRVIKVNNTAPKGLIEFTLKQDEFDIQKDLVNFETGEMITNYYKTTVLPSEGDSTSSVDETKIIEVTSTSYNVGIGYNKKVQATIEGYDEIDTELIQWSLWIKNYEDFEQDEEGYTEITDNSDIITNFSNDGYVVNFTLDNNDDLDYDFEGYILKVQCSYEDTISSREFNIVY